MNASNSYVYVIERAGDGFYWAHFPDLPGCVTSAESTEQVERQLGDAVSLYLAYFHERGLPLPATQGKTGR